MRIGMLLLAVLILVPALSGHGSDQKITAGCAANFMVPFGEITALFERETACKGEITALDVVKPLSQVDVSARAFVANYAMLVNGGVR